MHTIEQTEPKVWNLERLPEPSGSFSIPSIHDDTLLECRIYHSRLSSRAHKHYETKIATITHPYAPLGGCFDDHVLQVAGLEFLKQGYILALFNFRGAGASKGHTSWSSKPEQDDYLSFVGFLLCYMDELHQNTVNGMGRISGSEPMSEQVETPHRLLPPRSTSSSTDHNIEPSQGKWTLVLGGYSYGSQIVRHLPELSTILKQFNKPEYGTTASEIRLRAKHLADERARYVHATISRERTSPAASSLGSPVYGGDESQPGSRRVSRESRRSMDKVRKAVDHSLAHFSKKHKQLVQAPDSEPNIIEPERPLMIPEVRYLLISPLLPPLSGVLALSTRWFRLDPASEERLRDHHTLAIWGSDDFFTSSKRLTRWATSLQKHNDGSMFEFREVQDAGHFWLEDGTETELGQCLRSWLGKLDTR